LPKSKSICTKAVFILFCFAHDDLLILVNTPFSIPTEKDKPLPRHLKFNIDMPSHWVFRPSGDNGTLITTEEYEVG
jgi:hypothetical protein